MPKIIGMALFIAAMSWAAMAINDAKHPEQVRARQEQERQTEDLKRREDSDRWAKAQFCALRPIPEGFDCSK